jgi:hypothetical protein
MDQMEVDSEHMTHSGLTVSSSSFEILNGLDLDALNEHMRSSCTAESWETRIHFPQSQQSLNLISLITEVLTVLLKKLRATDMKSSFITGNKSDVDAIVADLDTNGLKEWKAMVQNCMEKNDWTVLIVHCAYIWITYGWIKFNWSHSKAPESKGAECSPGCSDRIQCAPFLHILLYYYGAHIPLIISPGSEEGMFTTMIQS